MYGDANSRHGFWVRKVDFWDRKEVGYIFIIEGLVVLQNSTSFGSPARELPELASTRRQGSYFTGKSAVNAGMQWHLSRRRVVVVASQHFPSSASWDGDLGWKMLGKWDLVFNVRVDRVDLQEKVVLKPQLAISCSLVVVSACSRDDRGRVGTLGRNLAGHGIPHALDRLLRRFPTAPSCNRIRNIQISSWLVLIFASNEQ